MQEDSRSALMRRIQAYSFVLYELNLFLDTHPNDKKALEFFKKYKDLNEKVTSDYNEKFGPVVAKDVNSDTAWNWIDDPWPWEREV